jgi:branched-chain amino acid transport system ATP-binding protein
MEGLAPVIVEEVAGAIKRMLEDDEMAVIIVEQHAELALKLTQQAILLERGRIVHRATSADLRKDKVALDRFIGLSIANPG